jgi:peptidoglycan biosynthesis protein MviN/MurJ (putative lipid II flippase)
MMNCPKCGKTNSDGAVFCGSCGGKLLPDGAESQGQQNPIGERGPMAGSTNQNQTTSPLSGTKPKKGIKLGIATLIGALSCIIFTYYWDYIISSTIGRYWQSMYGTKAATQMVIAVVIWGALSFIATAILGLITLIKKNTYKLLPIIGLFLGALTMSLCISVFLKHIGH